MKLLLLIVLNISFAYCDKTIWCYSGILNVDAEGQTNGIGKLIQGSITNPCVNATIVDANNKVGYLSFTLDFYQAFMKFYYSVIISDNVNLGCSAKINLYPSSSTSKGYTEYCLCADNVCNIGSTSPTQNCLSERKGLDYVGISDVYGEVEACADVNDVCITATGSTDYSTVSYKGCLGNLEANLGKYINKAVTKDTEKCHEVPVTGALKTAYLNFCMCSDEFCNVNFNTATSQDCTELTVGFNIYGWQDSKKTTISCNLNEPCGKIVAYDKGRWMSTQGCLSDLDPIIVKNNAISFPDNKCDKSNNKVDFQVVTGLDAQLCSCIGNCDYDAAPYSQCYSQSKGLDFIGISDYYNYFKEICTDNDSCYSVQTTGDNPFISFYGCSKVYNQFVAPHLVKPMTVTNDPNCFTTTLTSTSLPAFNVKVCAGKTIPPLTLPQTYLGCQQKYQGLKFLNIDDNGSNTLTKCSGPCINGTGIYNDQSFVFQGCVDQFERLLSNSQSISFPDKTCKLQKLTLKNLKTKHDITPQIDIKTCSCSTPDCNRPSSASILTHFNSILISCLVFAFFKM